MAERFGGYSLLEQIGVGGMAEVFLARHSGVEGFEKEIVIKRIRPHLSAIPSFVNMFLGEAKLAAQLNHPNIVQIYDLGKIKDSFFIAMEYVPGRDMSAVIPKSKATAIPFPVEYALKIASNVCEALYFAHTKADALGMPLHIVHRDVSPENIRVAWTGTVKILDFGIAKAATQLHETKAGEIKGKLIYMSPEQVMGKDVDHRSDIFSLGVVLYEWFTGLKLFSGENDLAIMNNIIEGKIYPPSYFRDDIPAEVESILMKALEKEPKRRYANACDMQLDIDTYLAGCEFTPSNIHLANFMKQLFKDELAAEKERRLAETPPSPARFSGASPKVSAPPPPPIQTGGSGELEVSAEVLEEEDTKDALLVALPPEEMHKLKRMAIAKSTTIESIVKEIVATFLKFQS
ncbi:MAG: serine/threonine protein kinase [Deltaproteobacteria bacterium]|nr:serine/threonine protein kinase [Deltaproteobacteria bacterium]